MTKFAQPPGAARWIIVLLAVLCLTNYGVAQQDVLDDTKDVIIDEPADKTEDVFDETEDAFDDDDQDFDQDRDHKDDCVLDDDVQDLDDDSGCVDFDDDQDRDDSDCDLEVQELDDDDSGCVDYDDDQDLEDDAGCVDYENDEDCQPEDECAEVDDDTGCDLDDEAEVEVEREKPTICDPTSAATTMTSDSGPIVISMEELEDNPESYYGKTVTVEGELHRIFNDKVFTIEDDGFFRDKDVLVINQSGNFSAIQACGGSFDPGEDIQVTGVVAPYERGKLECAYGPLDLESREGHSFTKNPVLIIAKPTAAAAVVIEREKPAVPEPAPLPEPAPVEPEATPEPIPEPPVELPRTAGEAPLLGLIGMLSLGAAIVLRRYSEGRAR
jgi:hypothetical protein